MSELIEKLAELEHEQWWEWSNSISTSENISGERIKRWQNCWVPYSDLPEEMKEHDRVWARKVLNIFESQLQTERELRRQAEEALLKADDELGLCSDLYCYGKKERENIKAAIREVVARIRDRENA